MGVRRSIVVAAFAALALPALAGAAAGPTATGIRIGDHPAFVRAVVDFAGGAVKGNEVDALGITKTTADLRVAHPGATTRAAARTAYGITVRVVQGVSELRIQTSFRAWRIKYISYAVVTGNRLAIDLWKSAPPARAAEVRTGAGGCLVLRSWRVTPGAIVVAGSERNLFEHTFQVLVRGHDGQVIGRRIVTKGPGAWSARVAYRSAHRQAATLEAVDFSPKDGAASCVAQVRVTLPAS